MLRPSRCCILNVYDCLVLKLQVICPLSNLHETNCVQSLRAGMVNQGSIMSAPARLALNPPVSSFLCAFLRLLL